VGRVSSATRGTVASIHRWPVKSLAGETVDAVAIDRRGVAGDRAHALFDEHKGTPRRLTIRQAPGMLRWSARYDEPVAPGEVPLPRVTGPDGSTYTWDDPSLAEALRDDLGRRVELRRDLELMNDLEDSILVTTRATLEAVSQALDRPLDLRRFRTNLHLELDAPAYTEERWEGRRLRVGETELELLHPCTRCVIPTRDPETAEKDPDLLRWLTRERAGLFGINARAVAQGKVAVGDPVELEP
jgi:uncharacterized protein YcbX